MKRGTDEDRPRWKFQAMSLSVGVSGNGAATVVLVRADERDSKRHRRNVGPRAHSSLGPGQERSERTSATNEAGSQT